MNEKDQLAQAAGMPIGIPRRGQLIPAMQIESVPGGFILTTLVQGDYDVGSRRELVPNVDALVSVVQRWAYASDKR